MASPVTCPKVPFTGLLNGLVTGLTGYNGTAWNAAADSCDSAACCGGAHVCFCGCGGCEGTAWSRWCARLWM